MKFAKKLADLNNKVPSLNSRKKKRGADKCLGEIRTSNKTSCSADKNILRMPYNFSHKPMSATRNEEPEVR